MSVVTFAISALLLDAASALLVPAPVPPAIASAAAPAVSFARLSAHLEQGGSSLVFPATTVLVADEAALSPAQAKLAAAKAASDAKLAARGMKAAETKSLSVKIDIADKDKDPFAQANELRAKRLAIEEKIGNGKRSKSQSAQIEQMRMMEKKSRRAAQLGLNRAAEVSVCGLARPRPRPRVPRSHHGPPAPVRWLSPGPCRASRLPLASTGGCAARCGEEFGGDGDREDCRHQDAFLSWACCYLRQEPSTLSIAQAAQRSSALRRGSELHEPSV